MRAETRLHRIPTPRQATVPATAISVTWVAREQPRRAERSGLGREGLATPTAALGVGVDEYELGPVRRSTYELQTREHSATQLACALQQVRALCAWA